MRAKGAFVAAPSSLVTVWCVGTFGALGFRMVVHGIANDSESKYSHSEGVTAVKRVTPEQFGDSLVVILCK